MISYLQDWSWCGQQSAAHNKNDFPCICNDHLPKVCLVIQSHKEETEFSDNFFVIKLFSIPIQTSEYIDREADNPNSYVGNPNYKSHF